MARIINEKEVIIVSYSTENNWFEYIPSNNWACLMIVDETSLSYLNEVIPKLISKDIGFVCVVGKGCETVHDMFDEEIVYRELDTDAIIPKHTILTVWDEDFEEGVWFGLSNAQNPDIAIDKIVVLDMTYGKQLPRVEKVLLSL